jgi:hypothetical protein
MNQLMLVVVALVALCYCGGNYCPTVLKQNKEMLLGGAIALVLCSFFGMKLEGYDPLPELSGGPEAAAAAAAQRQRYADAQREACILAGGQNCH